MFYSHTFLARKGPLGTVWCAAHLQHKLKKSQYTSTDITSTVERIMYPEVPIALRMSGHLLLGVVRIYSKKVDYLFQDCNFFLVSMRKAFTSVDVNLPEGETHAPFNSVTLPETFELDALNLDFDTHNIGDEDDHLKSLEDITLPDLPTETDRYITITFDQDTWMDSRSSGDAPGLGSDAPGLGSDDAPEFGFEPMDEDANPLPPVDLFPEVLRDVVPEPMNPPSPVGPSPEFMREAVQEGNTPQGLDLRNDMNELDKTLELPILNETEVITPSGPDLVASGNQFVQSPPRGGVSAAPTSDHANDVFDSNIHFEHESPQMAMKSTPPGVQPPVVLPQKRKRKQKQLYDQVTVFSNKEMKDRLKNSSNLLRKKRCCPSSALDILKSKIRSKKENIFSEPLLTGMCAALSDMQKSDYISSKPHLAATMEEEEEASGDPSGAHQSSETREAMPNFDMEIENLRRVEDFTGTDVLPEFMRSPNHNNMPSDAGFTNSPRTTGFEFTPASPINFGSHLEPQLESTFGTGVQPTPDFGASTGTYGSTVGTGVGPTPDFAASTGTFVSDGDTPMTFFSDQLGVENSGGLSDIPEVMNSAEEDDLNFLASENYTPTKFQKSGSVDTLSRTTRKVAEYFKERSSTTPIAGESGGDLVLNSLLEGKKRKICARMFYETLVLKSSGYVNVEQEEPYGDIKLHLTPKLFKDNI